MDGPRVRGRLGKIRARRDLLLQAGSEWPRSAENAGKWTCTKAGRRVLRPTPPTLKSSSVPGESDLKTFPS
ncbi:unnamed protein product, partial [Musa textilis]